MQITKLLIDGGVGPLGVVECNPVADHPFGQHRSDRPETAGNHRDERVKALPRLLAHAQSRFDAFFDYRAAAQNGQLTSLRRAVDGHHMASQEFRSAYIQFKSISVLIVRELNV